MKASIHERLAPVLFAAFLLVGGSAAFSASRRKPAAPVEVVKTHLEILRCHDGDTCEGRTPEGLKMKVRLLGVDAPEVAGKGARGKAKPGQAYGPEAQQYMQAHAVGQTLPVEIRGSDVYNRYLAILFTPDEKTRLNESLIREGLAFPYRGKGVAPDIQAWAQDAERFAKSEKKGFWALPESQRPAEPAEFRRQHR
jgi:micrococcal nuclease